MLLTPCTPGEGNKGVLMVVDMKGNTLKTIPTPFISADFRQWKIGGHTLYSYFTSTRADTNTRGRISTYCYFVLLDSTLKEIKKIHLLPFRNIAPIPEVDLDGHDAILLSEDHYIVFSDYPRIVRNIPSFLSPAAGLIVSVPIIEEVNNRQIVWQWDAGQYPEFYANSYRDNKYYDTTMLQDPIHMNSMTMDPTDSNLILSLPNLNQIVKISRKTGEIMWRLGGRNSDFELDVSQVFVGQHDVTVCGAGPTLLLLDNGAISTRKESRILEIKLDEMHKKIVSFSKTNLVARKSDNQGSVQIVGDNYFVCGGYGKYIALIAKKERKCKMMMYMNQRCYRAYYVHDIAGIK